MEDGTGPTRPHGGQMSPTAKEGGCNVPVHAGNFQSTIPNAEAAVGATVRPTHARMSRSFRLQLTSSRASVLHMRTRKAPATLLHLAGHSLLLLMALGIAQQRIRRSAAGRRELLRKLEGGNQTCDRVEIENVDDDERNHIMMICLHATGC